MSKDQIDKQEDGYHRVTKKELIDDLVLLNDEDEVPIFVHTASELDLTILSIYCDEEAIHIDVGPLED